MKTYDSLWGLAGFAVTSLLGTLLHFLYDWTDESILIASFSGVNESTWEHMKLLYFPLLIFALVHSRFFRDSHSFWCAKLIGLVCGLVLIPVLFYTYNGVFGQSPDWINIAIFFVSAAITFIIETRLIKNDNLQCRLPWIPFIIVCLIGILFIVFTFATPKLPIFKDPLSDSYGINS